jgi:hypothetical protein
MRRRHGVGFDPPGIPTIKSPHLGDLLLKRYKYDIAGGFEDLKRFELIDRLEKPVLNFDFNGTPKLLLDLQNYLAGFPYSFLIMTNKGWNLRELSPMGVYSARVFISRFPKLIEFIRKHEREIENDLWGLLYGYPLAEVHQFTYDWETWANSKKILNGS